MILSLLLSASFTFTATATGVEKGAPVEFIFAGSNTDRDYESMFLIDQSVNSFCKGLEKAGLPRGKPECADESRLWPVGCTLRFSPDLVTYIDRKLPQGVLASEPIYTGGSHTKSGVCVANDDMPASVFSTYSISQSPIVFNGSYNQGVVYGCYTAAKKLKKGDRVTFTVSWDTNSLPRTLSLVAKPGQGVQLLTQLREASEKSSLDVTVTFDESMTVLEATAFANALATVDSSRIRINGKGNVFFRSFLPNAKWRERKERLVQPFELTIGETNQLVHIDEDWSGEGVDPMLKPVEISFADAMKYPKTDCCFIYADGKATVSSLVKAMNQMACVKIRNWYVFSR